MSKKQDDLQKKWAEVIAKAWSDERFKEKLLKQPEKTLKEFGIEVPKGYKIQVHEEKNKIMHLYLPPRPEEEISEDELMRMAAAGEKTFYSITGCCC